LGHALLLGVQALWTSRQQQAGDADRTRAYIFIANE
jgi:hypothetical protein